MRFRSLALLLCVCAFSSSSALAQASHTVSCSKRTAPLTDGDLAFADHRWSRAAELYSAAASFQNEAGWRAYDGAVRSLLADDKVDAAESQVARMKEHDAKNPWTLLAVARVEWRKGHLNQGTRAAVDAFNADPCNALARYHLARVQNFAGNHATAQQNFISAHLLDVLDPGIWNAWVRSLPRAQQTAELEAFLAKPHDFPPEDRAHFQTWSDYLKKAPAQDCYLVNTVDHTSMPMRHVGEGAVYDPWGIDLQFNGKRRRLEVDTGASGIVLSKSAAAALHLEKFSQGLSYGAGDEGAAKFGSAVVKSIRIGELEFANCTVDVMTEDNKALHGTDGLIGGDVFSDFLVTLDFPAQKIELGALPPLPGGKDAPKKLDTTGDDYDRQPRNRYIDPAMNDWVWYYTTGSHIFIPTGVGKLQDLRLFLVDTGAGINNISRKTALEAGKISNGSMISVVGISGEVKKTFTTDLIELRFAGLRLPPEQFLGFDVKPLVDSTGVELGGVIGAPVLNLLTMKIDYRDALIKLIYDPKRLNSF